jgi:hypothetical protein
VEEEDEEDDDDEFPSCPAVGDDDIEDDGGGDSVADVSYRARPTQPDNYTPRPRARAAARP